MRAGCANAEQVCQRSGAASHCGSCVQLLTEVTGDPGGQPARAEVAKVGPRLAKVTLRPAVGERFDDQLLAGQHIVLSVLDGDEWVSRPYTVASAAEDGSARELFVRLRPDGRMAQRLSAAAAAGCIGVQLSKPRGEAFTRMRPRVASIFLIAGVGATPALSALRSVDGPAVRMVVAFLQEHDAALEDALRAACEAKGAELKVVTSASASGQDIMGTATAMKLSGGRALAQVDVEELAMANPDVDWFVCGPPGFERMTRRQLQDGGVQERDVHVERFLIAATDASVPPARVRSAAERRWASVGLGLAGLWALWAVLPAIEGWKALQSHDVWRAVTGSVMLAVLAWMWVFPVLRMRGCFAAARRMELTHRVVGGLSPLALLLHQRSLGYGLLCVLSALWVFNTVMGCCDKTMIRDPQLRPRYAAVWLPVHVVVSMVVTALSLWHVAMVLLFRGGVA